MFYICWRQSFDIFDIFSFLISLIFDQGAAGWFPLVALSSTRSHLVLIFMVGWWWPWPMVNGHRPLMIMLMMILRTRMHLRILLKDQEAVECCKISLWWKGCINPNGTLRTGNIDDRDVEDTTLRTDDFVDRRLWGQETLTTNFQRKCLNVHTVCTNFG